MDKLIINVALTGCIAQKSDNPALPITPEEVAADAKRCADLGATVFHVHARNQHGAPVWGAGEYRAYVNAVRTAVPGAVVCVSTSGRHWFGFGERAESLFTKPDMGSLTLGSVDFESGTAVNERRTVRALARRMKDLGVVPECEVFDLGHTYRIANLCRDGLMPDRFWVNVIYGPNLPAVMGIEDFIEIVAAEGVSLALGGVGINQWIATVAAISHGIHVRTGLEDNLKSGHDTLATNPALVQKVVDYARALGREPATFEEARGALGL